MSLRTNANQLSALTKELMVHWYETQYFWKDEKSRAFERKYLEELQASVDKAVVVIDELEKIVGKVKKDCE